MTAFPHPAEPGVLTVLRFGRDPLGMPGRYFERYGDTFATRLFGQDMLMTRDPAVMSEVLIRKASCFSKDKGTVGLSSFLGQGLLTNDGEAWRKNRRAFQPHFHPTELERYTSIFIEESQGLLASWPARGVINVQDAMARLTMRIALVAFFGVDPDECGSFEAIMAAAMRYFEGVAGTQTPLPTWIPTRTNRRFIEARTELRRRLGEIVESARRTGRCDTVLAQMLAARQARELSDEQLIDEAITMWFGGHETAALTLAYTLQLMAKHPLVQSQVHREVSESGVPTTLEMVQRKGPLKNALTESLRLYPVTWLIGREAKEDTEICGHSLKKGTQIYVHQWQAHRHPTYFREPEQFLPQRWAGDTQKGPAKVIYAPFGGGPRICIANHFALVEMSVILGSLIESFEFSRHTTSPLQFRASITARPKEPLLLRIVRRT